MSTIALRSARPDAIELGARRPHRLAADDPPAYPGREHPRPAGVFSALRPERDLNETDDHG